ncbi:hypothetical protein Tco_0853629 [Tanacetum coccineum]
MLQTQEESNEKSLSILLFCHSLIAIFSVSECYAMEEIDIRWQVAMITARIRKFMRKTGRPIDLKPKNGITFDKSKIELTYAMMALTEVRQDDWSMEFDAEHVHFGQDGLDLEYHRQYFHEVLMEVLSPSSRSSTTRTPHRPQRPKKIVKSIWVKKGSTVGSQAVWESKRRSLVTILGTIMIDDQLREDVNILEED